MWMIADVFLVSIWAPQEEGIFRISGRTTHITQLRKQFDAGACFG